MSDYSEVLQRARQQFPPPDLPLTGVFRRRDRRRRNQRIRAAALALILAAAAFGYAVKVIELSATRPAITPKNVARLKVAWKAGLNGSPSGSALNRIANPKASSGYWPNPILWAPTVSGATVFVASQSGLLYAYPTSCGSGGGTCDPKWVANTGGAVTWAPTVSGGVVYVATDNGLFYKQD